MAQLQLNSGLENHYEAIPSSAGRTMLTCEPSSTRNELLLMFNHPRFEPDMALLAEVDKLQSLEL